jgi:hypothetical protein
MNKSKMPNTFSEFLLLQEAAGPKNLEDELAETLSDLMAIEGGEPTDQPGSREVWGRARKLLTRYKHKRKYNLNEDD